MSFKVSPPAPLSLSLCLGSLICYAQWVVLRARKRGFHLLKQQLILVRLHVIIYANNLINFLAQEAADSTFYGQQLQQLKGTSTEEQVDGGGVVSLQQRMEARQSLNEDQREAMLREKRRSGQVSLPPPAYKTTGT